MKKVTWTMNGLMLPNGVKRQKTKPVLSTRMKKLTGKTSVRILVFKNGMGQDGHEVIVGKETMKKVILYQILKYKFQSFYGFRNVFFPSKYQCQLKIKYEEGIT